MIRTEKEAYATTNRESHLRSWAKSVTWRLIGILILGFISYVVTHDWNKTTCITVIFHAIRLVLYYFHERVWLQVRWGNVRTDIVDHGGGI